MNPERDVVARLTEISIGFPSRNSGIDTVVDRLSLTINAGERVGVIGASGSGKSLTALSILGLVPPPGVVVTGSAEVHGVDMFSGSEKARHELRGGTVGIVFQEAEAALNPVLTIGAHLEETIKKHRPVDEAQWKRIAVDLLEKVDLEPIRTIKSHPHRLSGGQRQRALLAIALAGQPDVLIADEPTSSLDVLTQARILNLIDGICREQELALLLISHDLGVVSSLVDRVVVLLAGTIVEQAPIREFLNNPLHPYSQSLVASIHKGAQSADLSPATSTVQRGCAFAPHCPLQRPECRTTFPDLTSLTVDRSVRCPVVAGEATK